VDTAFQPTAYDPVSTDERTLGLVLHAAWLGGPVATQGPDPAVRLARTGNERWLQVDFTTAAPLTSGRFDVDGEMLYAFRRGPGRGHAVLDVSRFAGRVLTLRPVVDFPRGDHEAAGLVIHEVRLK
jgi:hypothetical protein